MANVWTRSQKSGGPFCANCTAGGPSPTPKLAEEPGCFPGGMPGNLRMFSGRILQEPQDSFRPSRAPLLPCPSPSKTRPALPERSLLALPGNLSRHHGIPRGFPRLSRNSAQLSRNGFFSEEQNHGGNNVIQHVFCVFGLPGFLFRMWWSSAVSVFVFVAARFVRKFAGYVLAPLGYSRMFVFSCFLFRGLCSSTADFSAFVFAPGCAPDTPRRNGILFLLRSPAIQERQNITLFKVLGDSWNGDSFFRALATPGTAFFKPPRNLLNVFFASLKTSRILDLQNQERQGVCDHGGGRGY